MSAAAELRTVFTAGQGPTYEQQQGPMLSSFLLTSCRYTGQDILDYLVIMFKIDCDTCLALRRNVCEFKARQGYIESILKNNQRSQ